MASKNTPSKRTPPAAQSAKKPSGKSSPAGSSPLIDTNLAANAAAAMIGNKVAAPSAGAKKESAAFKQLKAGLNKPAVGALAPPLQPPEKQKKANLPFGGGKQIGHNQTFGADATRSGVPRRTSG